MIIHKLTIIWDSKEAGEALHRLVCLLTSTVRTHDSKISDLDQIISICHLATLWFGFFAYLLVLLWGMAKNAQTISGLFIQPLACSVLLCGPLPNDFVMNRMSVVRTSCTYCMDRLKWKSFIRLLLYIVVIIVVSDLIELWKKIHCEEMFTVHILQ